MMTLLKMMMQMKQMKKQMKKQKMMMQHDDDLMLNSLLFVAVWLVFGQVARLDDDPPSYDDDIEDEPLR